MSEKMRDGFEIWAISCGMCTYLYDVEYRHQSTEWAWRAWQASRAALVVELPQKRELSNLRNSYFDGKVYGFNDCIDYCAKSLDDAGVRYK